MPLRISAALILLAVVSACGGGSAPGVEPTAERRAPSSGADTGESAPVDLLLEDADLRVVLDEPRPSIVYVLVRAATVVALERLPPRLRRLWVAHHTTLQRAKALSLVYYDAVGALEDQLYSLPEEERTPARVEAFEARQQTLRQRFDARRDRVDAQLDARRERALEAFRAHVSGAFDQASSTTILALAELELQQGLLDASEGTTATPPDVSEAIDPLRRLLARGRFEALDERRVRYLLGYLLAQNGEHDAAAARWEALLEAPGDELQDEVHFRLGEHYFETGDLARAIAEYRSVAEGAPTHDLALYRLAWSHFLAEDWDQARAAALAHIEYSEAGRATPGRGEEKSPEMLRIIAGTLARTGDDRGQALDGSLAAPLRAAILVRLSRLLTDHGALARAHIALQAAEQAGEGEGIAVAREELAVRSGNLRARIAAFIEATARQCHPLEPGRYAVRVEPGEQGPEVTIDGLEPSACDPVGWGGDERVGGTALLTVSARR